MRPASTVEAVRADPDRGSGLSMDDEVVDIDAGVARGAVAPERKPKADDLTGEAREISLHELPAERLLVTTPRGLASDGQRIRRHHVIDEREAHPAVGADLQVGSVECTALGINPHPEGDDRARYIGEVDIR